MRSLVLLDDLPSFSFVDDDASLVLVSGHVAFGRVTAHTCGHQVHCLPFGNTNCPTCTCWSLAQSSDGGLDCPIAIGGLR